MIEKITSTLSERGLLSMAQNYNYKVKGFEIETKFWHWYRRGILKSLLNYYVGQRVWLNVYVRKTDKNPIDFSMFEIFEKSSSDKEDSRGDLKVVESGEFAKRGIKSNQLWEQGSYKIFLRYKTPNKYVDYILMYANIVHPDVRNRIFFQTVFAATIGAILGAAFTYLMLMP